MTLNDGYDEFALPSCH